MKNTFAKKFTVCALAGVLGFALSACDDSSSAGSNETEASSSSVESSDNEVKSSSSAKETKNSSDFRSSSSSKAKVSSSSSVALATPCKTETEDNCEYGTLLDERDGQEYKTVKIGDQWWMAENLNYETDSSYCYNSETDYCDKYGRLYMWAVTVGKAENECGYKNGCLLPLENIQGVCPSGWHIPSYSDWNLLVASVGGEKVAGAMLKNNDGWLIDGSGEDAFGFSALPAGARSWFPTHFLRDSHSDYTGEGQSVDFWSSLGLDSSDALAVLLNSGYKSARFIDSPKCYAHSVRCIKNSSEPLITEEKKGSGARAVRDIPNTIIDSSPCKTEAEDNCEYGSLTDNRDGQTYKTVKIDGQWWMAENLNFAMLHPTIQEDSSSFCYEDSLEYCEKYGRLYLWSAAMDSVGVYSNNGNGCGNKTTCSPIYPVRGVCPEGWHLPSKEESKKLVASVGGKKAAGIALKSVNGWKTVNLGFGIDAFGFTALPAGWRANDTLYVNRESTAYFWNSTESKEHGAGQADYFYMESGSDDVMTGSCCSSKESAFSVRCVKDSE